MSGPMEGEGRYLVEPQLPNLALVRRGGRVSLFDDTAHAESDSASLALSQVFSESPLPNEDLLLPLPTNPFRVLLPHLKLS